MNLHIPTWFIGNISTHDQGMICMDSLLLQREWLKIAAAKYFDSASPFTVRMETQKKNSWGLSGW